MIAIVDGGSTKCDWVILDSNGELNFKAQTTGFNPNIIDAENIPQEILKNEELAEKRFQIKHVFFYGSGCGVPENQEKVKTAFSKVFTAADVTIKEDLTAAAYSAYNGKPAIVCILGTGSNSCYFDGENVRTELPSLGFLIGDEGSGCALGKLLVKNYFMKKMPADLHAEFTKEYQLNIEELIKNMYHNPRANAYLAEFSKFIVDRKEHPFLQHLIYEELKNYLDFQVLPYEESKTCEINFIGSIAYYYEEILRAAAADLHLNIGTIVKKPIERLVEYHKTYILPNLAQ
ncbi:MAG: BadF/BadG/BcrA/BcrD ATPase family protein [Cruoricaptor ignavus]|nr:BadF/BadG/BcrA/BcrD ATPase family protein [Cruoricaptor ignavus]